MKYECGSKTEQAKNEIHGCRGVGSFPRAHVIIEGREVHALELGVLTRRVLRRQ